MKRYPEAEDDGVVFVTNPPWARSVPQPLADIQAGGRGRARTPAADTAPRPLGDAQWGVDALLGPPGRGDGPQGAMAVLKLVATDRPRAGES